MPAQRPRPSRRYRFDGYISYARPDEAWAKQLHTLLEGAEHSIVLNTSGSSAGGNKPPGRTLHDARHLIVIWTEASALDPAITREIDAFRSARRDFPDRNERRFIFLVLVTIPLPDDLEPVTVITDFVDGELPAVQRFSEKEVWNRVIEKMKDLFPGEYREPAQEASNQQREDQSGTGGLGEPSAAQKANVSGLGARNRRPGGADPNAKPAMPISSGQRLFFSVENILHKSLELFDGFPQTSLQVLASASATGGKEAATTYWAADWIRAQLGEEGHKRLIELAGPAESSSGVQLMESARRIAEATSGSAEIHARHLIGALLTEPSVEDPNTAAHFLKEVDDPPGRLRLAYYDWVRDYGDEDDAWGELLLGELPQIKSEPNYHADDDSSEDRLDIRGDVLPLAGLIAARTIRPPLSIGLFGEWGSGKTFFMRTLRKEVACLAREAREATANEKVRQRDQLFYRRIVQIEFNAWHYVEGNLWASLVQHIFDNLYVIDDRKKRASEALQEPILRKIEAQKEVQAQAARDKRIAEKQRGHALVSLKRARQAFEEKARELAKISARNVLAIPPSQELKDAANNLLKEIGITGAIERGTELKATLTEARSLLERGQAALVPLMSSKDRGMRWLWLTVALLSGPAAALIAALVAHAKQQPEWSNVAAMVSGASAFIATITTWLRNQVSWVGDHLKEIERVQREFDASIEKAQAANQEQIRKAEEQLRLLEADYVAAKQREEEARRVIAELESKAGSIPQLLKTFIEERANSNDYRRHLGMLALVRNDFEKLSDLISEENEQLDERDDIKARFKTLEDEMKDEPTRVNRIVLYIDDLDRCPPARVVEVLQAVHLLLAFPLFVVVVGVDARWLTRSLEARYRELLKSDDSPSDDPVMQEFRTLFGTANAHDYVEKIFQVPFWLKPMTTESVRRMLFGVLKGSIRAETSSSEPLKLPGPVFSEATQAQQPPVPHAAQVPTGTTADKQPSEPLAAKSPTPPAPDLSAKAFEFQQSELNFMSELATLLGRSPRTLKRFMNVYLLMRVGLSQYQRQLFLEEQALPDYKAVLFLLAVDTGAPLVARVLLPTMRGLAAGAIMSKGKQPQALAPTFGNLIEIIDKHPETKGDNLAQWQRVRRWLADQMNQKRLPDDVSRVARWVPHVSRFSFHTGRLEDASV